MRRWTKAAAVASTTAVATAAAAQLGDVTGYTTIYCSGEDLVYSFDSAQEACRTIGIEAYIEWDVSDECRICEDDSLPDDSVRVPPCPRGQHGHGWDCHADHVCGDDEIGGGDEDCTKCGEGEVPNEDGTACVSCDWGESSEQPGRCSCDYDSLDALAVPGLRTIPRNPREEAERYLCLGIAPVVSPHTHSTKGQEDVCEISLSWGQAVGIAAIGHSHPYFDPYLDYPGGVSFKCRTKVTDSGADALTANYALWDFSSADTDTAEALGVPVYLVVPHRSQVKVYRQDAAGAWGEEIVWESPW